MSPAPLGSSVTDAGMLATAQCQNPLAVGASGSYTVTAKLLVPSGNPDHDSCGERSSPPAPMTPLTCGVASVSPSAQSVLVTVKEGTCGRKSYGLGGVGRSAMVVSSAGTGRAGTGVLGRAEVLRSTLRHDCSLSDTCVTPRAGSVRPVPVPGRLGLPDSIRACLFDLDGVLTRTATVHFAAWKRTFDEFLHRFAPGQPEFSQLDYNRYVDGKHRADGVRGFLASRDITLPEGTPGDPPEAATVQAIATRKNDMVLRELEEHGVEVYPGSVRYLRAVKEAGPATAVVTASANGEKVIAAGGFADLIDVRVDGLVAARDGAPGQAGAGHLPGRRPPARRGARRRPWSTRTRSPAWRRGGRAASDTSSGWTGSARPRH